MHLCQPILNGTLKTRKVFLSLITSESLLDHMSMVLLILFVCFNFYLFI